MELEASIENSPDIVMEGRIVECGTVHLRTGPHELYLYTHFVPSWVTLEVQGSGRHHHCGGEIEPDLVMWAIRGEGINLLAEIHSDFVRVKWRAIP